VLFGRVTFELMEAGWRGPEAAASLRAGLRETLTVTRLGISDSLLETGYGTGPWSR